MSSFSSPPSSLRSHLRPSLFRGCGNLCSRCCRQTSLLCSVQLLSSGITERLGRSRQSLQLPLKLANSLFELALLTSDCCQNIHSGSPPAGNLSQSGGFGTSG